MLSRRGIPNRGFNTGIKDSSKANSVVEYHVTNHHQIQTLGVFEFDYGQYLICGVSGHWGVTENLITITDKLTEGQKQEDDGGRDEVHGDVVPGEVDPRRLLHLVQPFLILEEVPKPVWMLISVRIVSIGLTLKERTGGRREIVQSHHT